MTPQPPVVNLALQGGGAHGAFTWGVLDALLEDGRLAFDGLSGASAGAMNAAVLVQGWVEDGPEGARAALDRFWHRIATHQALTPLRSAERALWGHDLTWSLAWQGFDTLVRRMSPYQFNPLGWNPLRNVIRDTLDFDRIRAEARHRLFVAATDVASGKIRVFTGDELSAEALVASACLPFLFQAPEIDGRRYWDGGYAGNPPLWPLVERCAPHDIVLVEVNPVNRPDLPVSAPDILNRMNEIGMTAPLRGEIRALERGRSQPAARPGLVRRLVRAWRDQPQPAGWPHIHAIHDDEAMAAYNVSTKFNTELSFLHELKALGVSASRAWLAGHFNDLGVRDSVDLRARYL